MSHPPPGYPPAPHPRVALLVDNAPWHRGAVVDATLADHPHLEFERVPAYSPQLNPIERFWETLRRRATHNRRFGTLADLKASIRASLSDFQIVRHKVKSLIEGRPKRKAPGRDKNTGCMYQGHGSRKNERSFGPKKPKPGPLLFDARPSD